MNNSKKMTEIIEKKKELSQEKTPKYGTRKLSIGLVSCMLGFSLIIAPGSSKAAEASENETVATEKNTPEENPVEEATPVANEEIKKEEIVAKQADTFVEKLETIEVEEGEEIDYKEAVTNLPQDAKLDVITPVDTKEAGEKTTSAKITFADGSEKEIKIKVNVKAVEADAEKLEISELKDNEAQTASPSEEKLPTNRTDKPNWEEEEKKGDDYWKLGKTDKLENQRLVRVTTSDPIEIVDTTYQGYFVDANGRTNLRLVYMEKSAAISAVWKKAEFNFGKLVDKIDFDKSYGVDQNGKRYTFSTTNNDGIYTLNVAEMISARTQNKNNLPINLVLKDGVTLESLGEEDYKIQMRLVDANGERVYAFAPGKASLDYSTYTRTTSVSLKNKINSEFLRGPEQKKGDILAVQRSFMAEFIANPAEYNDTTDLGVLRTQYQSETGAIPGNTTDGKPHGFMQMFDAGLVKYLKPDAAGYIAYTQILDAARKEDKSAKRIGIKLSDLNYTADGKLAYFIIGEANFQKDGVKVVRVDSMKNSVYVTGIHFTAIDYVVDKKQFVETFEATGKNKVDFSVMTGWIESNPKGWTIFEEEFDHDYVVPEGESFIIDLGKDPEGDQIMVQVGDEVHSFVRTQQGYYAGYKGGSAGFEKIEKVKKGAIEIPGLYKVTLREGATIKKGDKFRILLPDSADHDAKVSLMEATNGSKYNEGAAKLQLETDRNINMHLYRKDKGSFKLYYTLKGETEQKVLEFTKGVLWKYDDKDKVLTGVPNKATDPSGGNFWINVKKLEPGTKIYVEAYNEKGELEQDHTSYFDFNGIEKSTEKYTKMAWVDHSDVLAGISIQKSLFTPYQEIFTNDYTGDQQKDFYENPRQNPTKTDDFMKNTEELLGFTKYDGGKIRMRYIDPSGVIYISKADADANEYNDKGDITKDYTKKITVNGKEYVASPYRLNLKDFSQLKENRDAGYVNPDGSMTLVKDMRLIINASDGSSIPSDWLEVRVKTRVLFDATDGAFDNGTKQSVKVVPDNVKFLGDEGYAPNGFTGANVKTGTGDEFVSKPTAEGKTFLGWATAEGKAKLGKTIVKAEDYNNLEASMKFTSETAVTTHQVVYAIWSEETLITFDANGGKFDDDSTTKTDDIKDGVQAPTNPTQEGKEFLGWASTKDATAPEDGILDNVTEAKTVYAVWKDAETQKTEAPTVTAPKAGATTVSGTGKPGAKVNITKENADGSGQGTEIARDVVVGDDGTWTANVPEGVTLEEGDIIYATQKEDGKTVSDQAEATVTGKDEETSQEPTIKEPKAGDTSVSGTGVPGATVVLKDKDGNKIGEATVDQDGNWTVDNIPADKLVEGEKVTAEQTEPGKKPASKEATVAGKEEKLAAPTVEANDDGSVTITPPVDEDIDSIHITYTDEKNEQGTLVVTKDAQGNWTLPQGTDQSITVDPTTGKVTIPADQVADGTVVTAFVQKGNDSSDDATATAKTPKENTKVGGDVKPVKPTDDKQDTGIKVENKDDDTEVTAKDEDGKDVPVEIDENGNVIVTPGKNVDGPITVTIKDPDLPGGKVEIEVPVEGHEKGKDDNNSDKDGNKTIADKTNPTVPSKTEVKDKNNLTDEEKDKVKKAIEDANKDKFPQGTKVEIGKDGTATITYPDGSVDIIKGNDLVSQKANAGASGSINRVNSSNTGKNVKTGVGSSATILATLAAAVSGLFASKKRKND